MGRGAAAFAEKGCCSSPHTRSKSPAEGTPRRSSAASAKCIRAPSCDGHCAPGDDEIAALAVMSDEEDGEASRSTGLIGELSLMCGDGWVPPPLERLSPLQAARLRLCLATVLSTRLSAESRLWARPDVDVLEIVGGSIKTGIRLVFSRAARDLALSERGALVLHPGSFMRSTAIAAQASAVMVRFCSVSAQFSPSFRSRFAQFVLRLVGSTTLSSRWRDTSTGGWCWAWRKRILTRHSAAGRAQRRKVGATLPELERWRTKGATLPSFCSLYAHVSAHVSAQRLLALYAGSAAVGLMAGAGRLSPKATCWDSCWTWTSVRKYTSHCCL